MPPRAPRARRAEPEPTAGRSTLIRCFLWELAQALKESYCVDNNYNMRQKHTFAINYAKHVPLRALQLAALEAFAPPTQRVMSQLRQIFARHDIPDELSGPLLEALDLPAASLDDVCSKVAPWFLGELQEVAGKLTIGLPKDGDKVSKDKDTNKLVHAFDNYRQGLLREGCFWRQYLDCDEEGASPPGEWTGVNWPLARRIMAAERGLTPTTISEHLGLPRIPQKDEPHSLELLIRLVKRGGWGQSDTRSVVATMVVPHDVSCCDLDAWMCELDDFEGVSRGFSYLNVRYMGMHHRSTGERLPDHHKELCGVTEQEAALPLSLCVRVWAIMAGECGSYGYDSGAYYDSAGEDSGGEEALVEEVSPAGFTKCAVLGSREALTRKAVARVLADEDLFDGDPCYRPEQGGGPPKNIDVKFHAAVADVLPLPEEVRPTMEEFAANPSRYSCGNNWTAEMEWSKMYNQFEASAVRRLPRLPDEQYPVITKIRSVPHAYL